MSLLKKLQNDKSVVVADMRAVLNAASAENDRDLSADEEARYAALQSRLTSLNTNIDRERLLQDEERNLPAPAAFADPKIKVGTERETERPFASFGEQLQAIAQAGMPGGVTDPRLYAAASGANTTVGSDGGFLVHKDFSSTIYEKGYEAAELAPRCDQVEISAGSDGLEVPYVDETSRANGSRWGGVRVYRRAEADTVTASRPKLGLFEVRLEDLMGIAYATGRLLQDASALEQVMTRAFSSEFAFKLDDEIVRGTGVGECLGLTGSPAFLSVSKETGQQAATIQAENIQKMWARLWSRSRKNAVWFYNQECETQLQNMQIGTGSSAQLVYMPPGGISGAQYGTIYGRPVIPIEQASALGTLGDIFVADLSEYALIKKGGLQSDQSMHVRFLYDEMTFRFIMRVNGKPKWSTALTPFKGGSTLSPYVGLAARA